MAGTYNTYTTAALAAAGTVTALGPNDNVGTVQVGGTYTSVVGTIQVTADPPSVASPAWNNVDLIRVDTLALEQSPTWTDSTVRTWKFDCTNIQQVRVNVTGGTLSSGMTIRVTTGYTQVPLGGISYATAVGGNQAITGQVVITSASANALAVGPNGSTNPTLNVTANVSSEAGGLNITGAADNLGVALAAIGSNTNEPLKLDAKGSSLISIGTVSTGGANLRLPVATVAATGSAIGNAAAVVEGFTYVTGSNNTAGIQLPASVAGKQVTIVNTVGTALLLIYPPASSQINAKGVNNVYNIPNAAMRTFICATTTLWYAAPETIA